MAKKKRISNESSTPKLPKPIKSSGHHKYTDEMIAQALMEEKGLQYLAADRLGINYCHMSERISASPYLQKVRDNAKQIRLDIAERSLSRMVEEQELGAIIYTLKTLGKDRGYVETVQHTVPPETINQFDAVMKQIRESRDKA